MVDKETPNKFFLKKKQATKNFKYSVPTLWNADKKMLDSLKMQNLAFSPLVNLPDSQIVKLGDGQVINYIRRLKHAAQLECKKYTATTIEVGGKRFYMNALLQRVLDHFLKSVKRFAWDFVILIDGIEGSGKSSVGKAVAFYLTKKFNKKNTFTNDNIVFTVEQFFEALDKAKPGSVILWDEFVLGGLSTDMTAIQNALIKKFTLIRKKRLFIILVIPYLWMLRTYFAIGRTKMLIHVYSEDFISRGTYLVYGFNKKHQLFFQGKEGITKWRYTTKPDFRGNFLKDIVQKNFFTNDKEYEQKKDEATMSVEKHKEEKEKKKKGMEKSPMGLDAYKVTGTCKNCGKRGVWREKETQKIYCEGCEKYEEDWGVVGKVKDVFKKLHLPQNKAKN